MGIYTLRKNVSNLILYLRVCGHRMNLFFGPHIFLFHFYGAILGYRDIHSSYLKSPLKKTPVVVLLCIGSKSRQVSKINLTLYNIKHGSYLQTHVIKTADY